jgi:hypothetical protein
MPDLTSYGLKGVGTHRVGHGALPEAGTIIANVAPAERPGRDDQAGRGFGGSVRTIQGTFILSETCSTLSTHHRQIDSNIRIEVALENLAILFMEQEAADPSSSTRGIGKLITTWTTPVQGSGSGADLEPRVPGAWSLPEQELPGPGLQLAPKSTMGPGYQENLRSST